MRQWIRNEKGNVLIMVALTTAVLAGFGILTIDIGRVLVTRTQLQNAADAGALAGAGLFCSGTPTDAEVQAEAKSVADMNKALETNAVNVDTQFGDILVERGETGNDVTVTTRSDSRQFLTGLFNVFRASDPRGPGEVPDEVTEAAVSAIATARCGGVCSVSCVKPWSIPDRWDDVTGIPGYMGDGPGRSPTDWRNNDDFDHEIFTDSNESGKWEPGETYTDGNGNGRYDQEGYHPSLTGYGPDPVPGNFLSPNGDLGLELTLHPGMPSGAPEPGQYYSVRLPPINKGLPHEPGGDEYRENIANCNPVAIEAGDWLRTETGLMKGPTNQGMTDLIRQDPDAEWDDATQSVIGSNFSVSPRIVLIPIHDPRIAIRSGNAELQVVKVAAFFMERMVSSAEVRGRFLKVRQPGAPCVDGQTSGFFVYNLSLIR